MHKSFKLILLSLLSLSISAFIWGIITFLFLAKFPTSYINIQKNNNFYNIHLAKLFVNTKYHPKITKNIQTLRGIKLKAVFENGNKSFIIIDDKKEIFLDLNKKYKGYKLIKVTNNSAIFEKNHKKFALKLNKLNVAIKNTPLSNIKDISKQTLTQYIKHPAKIWKNISINKTKNGYKVFFVKKGSIFNKLGLRKGDYILQVNHQPLKTDADAWKIYKNINNFDEINIKIKRHNQIKELHYEIY